MRTLILLIPVALWLAACSDLQVAQQAVKKPPPLVDTLLAVFARVQVAVEENRTEDFLGLLDSAAAIRLGKLTLGKKAAPNWVYLKQTFVILPQPDSLVFVDLIQAMDYARVTMAGDGARIGYNRERIRYFFLLFRKQASGWKVAAVSQLEKDRFDDFGTELSYFETELQPHLRFPRRF